MKTFLIFAYLVYLFLTLLMAVDVITYSQGVSVDGRVTLVPALCRAKSIHNIIEACYNTSCTNVVIGRKACEEKKYKIGDTVKLKYLKIINMTTEDRKEDFYLKLGLLIISILGWVLTFIYRKESFKYFHDVKIPSRKRSKKR